MALLFKFNSPAEIPAAHLARCTAREAARVLDVAEAVEQHKIKDTADDVMTGTVFLELNNDPGTKGLSVPEIQSIVAAWLANAISRDTMTEFFRRGEVLPEVRSTEEEAQLIAREPRAPGQPGVLARV